MHVARAEKPAQVGDILRDEPAAILRNLDVLRLDVAIKQPAQPKQKREADRDEQRSQKSDLQTVERTKCAVLERLVRIIFFHCLFFRFLLRV